MSAPCGALIPWYGNDLYLRDPLALVAGQEGYRWRGRERGALDPGWDARWLVIGDHGGDPVIAHTDAPGTPISLAAHGTGSWALYRVAPSLAAYLAAVAIWIEVGLIAFGGRYLDDSSVPLPRFRGELEARLAAIFAGEYRQHWLFLD